ncbi:YozD family protein [Bacillus sp. FJAT-50079]|uniref:YozD family protein n=1 Tax=Bacillus sp. FJAT-50079 TaxID=2833577 RepID=UPI001BC9709F|nr:YozD family protein [Bacillus sp. FJAT-50079]MBS4209847.1 YozD family protein [Bacillus sp. FJAT-50079]
MGDLEVFIDTEEISEFFYEELLRRGFHVTEDEADVLADITFDYLIEKRIIDEEAEEY